MRHNSIEGGRASRQRRSSRRGHTSHGTPAEEEQVSEAPHGSLQIHPYVGRGRTGFAVAPWSRNMPALKLVVALDRADATCLRRGRLPPHMGKSACVAMGPHAMATRRQTHAEPVISW
jgi:hypothetical protein